VWKAPFALVAVATVLPVTIVTAVALTYSLIQKREEFVERTRQRAVSIVEASDARLAADLAALKTLAASPPVQARDLVGARRYFASGMHSRPDWLAIGLCVATQGRPAVAIGAAEASAQLCEAGAEPAVGGVARLEGAKAVTVLSARLEPSSEDYVAVVRTTDDLQALLLRETGEAVVAGIVDANGRFAARTLEFPARAGLEGSAYLRAAAARGGTGVYPGRTLEGVWNYTAYATSPRTNWSAHIAISGALVDARRSQAVRAAVVGGLAALLVAAVLLVLVARDLRERARAAERLKEAQTLEALGRLTAGVAHDFNNVLTGVIASIEIVKRSSGENPRALKFANVALEAARRGASLTAQLLSFARAQTITLAPLSIDALFDGAEALLRPVLGPTIALTTRQEEEDLWVSADQAQLEVALLNLAVNAAHAMPDGGALSLYARPLDGERAGGGLVEITVRDTGHGMDEATLQRAMEPFFTTKPPGQGTGLGLAQVSALMRRSGGDLRIESTPGVGTAVRLVLAASKPPSISASHSAPAAPARTQAQSILIVDDHEAVRLATAESLRDEGYDVVEATGVEDALSTARARAPRLAIIDLSAGDGAGGEIADALRRELPSLKIIVIASHARRLAAESLKPDALVLKPFESAALLAHLRALAHRD
jgi:signal transduction histidine kinase